MLFTSYAFIFFFLPLSLVVYFFLNRQKLTLAGKAWLTFSSLVFYCWWNVIYLPLILVKPEVHPAVSNHQLSFFYKPRFFQTQNTLVKVGVPHLNPLLGDSLYNTSIPTLNSEGPYFLFAYPFK